MTSSSPHVFDVTADTFQTTVIAGSREVPILLDFWADWCAPCRTLGPILEKLADEYGGAFRMGKVDTEREVELASVFQVQSLPTVLLIKDGRPVDGFAGALPEPELRRFLESKGIEPTADEVDSGEGPEPETAAWWLQSGRDATRRGDAKGAQEALSKILDEDDEHAVAGRLLDGLAVFDHALNDGSEAAQQLAAGRRAFLEANLGTAADAFLSSVAADKSFAEGLARRALVLCLEFVADEEVANEYRRRMATLLY